MNITEPLKDVFEDLNDRNTPPEPTVIRRAASYSDFYHVVRSQISKDAAQRRRQRKVDRKDRGWEALMLQDGNAKAATYQKRQDTSMLQSLDGRLLEASQRDHLCDQQYSP